MSSDSLNVIALISGGKDSFFNLIHCIHHGHRIVALANLFPAVDDNSAQEGIEFIDPSQQPHTGLPTVQGDECEAKDLNSFMYQTVGHEVIPLYAAATGLPLYRQPIRGAAVHHERDYDYAAGGQESSPLSEETESMLLLLQAIKTRHPEANAICSGAILSTYQRTRVESVALRLGLTPLAYLWKYPVLPPPLNTLADEAQLLRDMAAAGLEARIIKVASAGLDESHLWEQVSSNTGVHRVKTALRKFGAAEGAALGEGGEFETLVLDGPSGLFKKRVAVPEAGRKVVHEGGGSSWLMLRGAQLQDKSLEVDTEVSIRVPDLFDAKFQAILDHVLDMTQIEDMPSIQGPQTSAILGKKSTFLDDGADVLCWSVLAESETDRSSIEDETRSVVDKIRELLSLTSLDAAHITNTLVILRDMSDFPKVNAEYGKLFTKPNPPSRITISCGDLLPAGHNIIVYLTAPNPAARSDRDGLHVQSRSYWAPANIGPYSQAVDVAITVEREPTGLRGIHIAGQIPLIPASMVLPTPSKTSHQLQIILSLQHLWRIGLEMKVQFWTSAVAYFARSSSDAEMEHNAKLAGLAWKLAHGSPEDDEDDENGPDPWDLKYNPQHMSLGGPDQGKAGKHLPDWSIFTLRQQNEPELCIPPFFAAEIEELPRQSAVEWHAHTGLSRIEESNAELVFHPEVGIPGWRAWHVVVRASSKVTVVHTTVSYLLSDGTGYAQLESLKEALVASYQDSVRRLGIEVPTSPSTTPHLIYIDTTKIVSPWQQVGDAGPSSSLAVVPCRSIWSWRGERVGCVAMYRTMYRSDA